MSSSALEKILHSPYMAYVQYEILSDAGDASFDCRFLDISPSFGKISGLKINPGSTLTQVLSKGNNPGFDWPLFLRSLSSHRVHEGSDYYSTALSKWYGVKICSR